jgi:superfamily II DNA/RNA helicase
VPGSAGFVSGETLPHDRRRIISEFRDGKLRHLCNCMILTEGFDAPAASAIVMARPTKSRSLYAQCVGRGTRVLGGLIEAIPGREGAAERRAIIAASYKPNTVILDFVGNSTKHALVSPEDLLGGDYSDEEVALAKKKAKGADGANPTKMLEEARKELQRIAAAIRSKVDAKARVFDPFAVLDIDITSTTREDMRWGRQPPTPGQMEALERMKLPLATLKSISKREASKLLNERSRRHNEGLATFAQLGHLKKFGVDNVNLSFAAAGAALTYIAQDCGWSRSKVDPARLAAIVGTAK